MYDVTELPPDWSIEQIENELKKCMFGLSNTGICCECGAEHSQVEPDAQGYTCESCGAEAVCGVEHIFISVVS